VAFNSSALYTDISSGRPKIVSLILLKWQIKNMSRNVQTYNSSWCKQLHFSEMQIGYAR